MTSKLSLLGFAWFLALLISLALRFWGSSHPDPFLIRISLVWILVFAPALFLGVWIIFESQYHRNS